ncbi:MAG: GntR family transcriptional regulator [Bradyrhizobium sp.]
MSTTTPQRPAEHDFRALRTAAPLRQSVLENIRNAIASGRFAAGSRLVEKDLCEMVGVSRTLVRESLRQLESEGLIEVIPHRGPVVARLSIPQAMQIYRVRSELEALASELFALNAKEDDLRDIRAALKQLKAAANGNDATQRLAAKREFYNCLVRGGGNEVLGQTLNLLNSRMTLLRVTSMQRRGRWQKSVQELGVLVDALAARDAVAARAAAATHVANAAEAALEVLQAPA